MTTRKKKKKKTKAQKARWLQFRDQWLSTRVLACEYCGRSDLISDAPLPSTKTMSPSQAAKRHIFSRKKIRSEEHPHGLDPERIATVDHIIPQSFDGVDEYDTSNFAVACNACNQDKRNQTLEEWRERMSTILTHLEEQDEEA